MHYPTIKVLQRAAEKPVMEEFELGLFPLVDHYPRLGAWLARLDEIEACKKTYPPHWREA